MGRFFVHRQQSRRQGYNRYGAEPHDVRGFTGGHITRLGGFGGVGGIGGVLLRGGGFFRLVGVSLSSGWVGVGVSFSSLSVKVTAPLLLLSEEFQSQ